MEYRYPATLDPDEDGRVLVRFADFPEALTDGADLAEALVEAADCLSEALASRIVDGEQIPSPSEAGPGQHIISPSPTIALKAALYTALRHRDMTVADLAGRLDIDWHQAARLIDPRRASKLTSLAAALGVLNCQIELSVYDPELDSADAFERAKLNAQRILARIDAERVELSARFRQLEAAERSRFQTLAATASALGKVRAADLGAAQPLNEASGAAQTVSLSDATLRAVQAHGEGATPKEVLDYLAREFGMTVRPNHLGIALQRHRRAGRLEENRDHRWFRIRQP
jgi:antitoxin HicB